jgi:anti-anti-sigma factor
VEKPALSAVVHERDDGPDADAPQDRMTVELDGTADFATLAALRRILRRVPDDMRVVIDCNRLRFIDSSGLRALVEKRLELARHGGELTLRNASSMLQRILQLTGLDAVLLDPSVHGNS